MSEDVQDLPDRLGAMIRYFARQYKFGVAVLFLLPTLSSAITASISFATRLITDAVLVVQKTGGTDWSALKKPFALFLGLILLQCVVDWTTWAFSYRIRIPMLAKIRATIFAYVQRHATSYFDNRLTGKVAHKTVLLPEQIHDIINKLWFDFVPAVAFFVVVMGYFALANLAFAATVAVWLLVFYITVWFVGRDCTIKAARHNDAKTHITGRIVDTIVNIKNVIFNAAHSHEDTSVGISIGQTMTAQRALYLATVRLRVVMQGLNIVMWIALFGGATWFWAMHKITAGDFLMITTLAGLLIRRAYDIGQMIPDFFDILGSAQESIDTLVVPRDLADAPGAKPVAVTGRAIAYDGVKFAYDGKQTVFSGLAVEIPGGQRVGLLGPSGAGKSTFVSLLLRLHDVQSGAIRIDGQDIRSVTQTSLRASIGLIPQDTILFHRTLMDNIRYGRQDASEDEVMEAARKAFAHDFIQALPKGYHTMVGERGVKLSGGQRQRIAIARALLKNAPILILDEATSSLDSESEQMIQKAMANAMDGKTVIAIAHRLSTIMNMDRLLVMNEGKIVGDGTHAALLAEGGLYTQLWQRQSGGFIIDPDTVEAA